MNQKILRFCSRLLLVIVCTLFITGIANQNVYGENRQKLVDDANLLSSSDKEHVEALLMKISEKNQHDIVIVTKESLRDEAGYPTEALDYAKEYYHSNDYGYGQDQDGIILVIGMENRDYAVYPCGPNFVVYTDEGLNYIENQVIPSMTDGDYAKAFTDFANLCDQYVEKAKEGEPYDEGDLPKKDLTIIHLLIAIAIGAGAAAVGCFYMKSQLNTIHPKNHASDYVVKDSLMLSKSSDRFLYFITKKTPRPKSNSSGGHSTSGGHSGHF